jgi:GxxExxY protein
MSENTVSLLKVDVEDVAKAAIDAAYIVYSNLGPGLLESVYEQCLIYEIRKKGLNVESQISIPVYYDGMHLDAGFRIDILVERSLVIELKTVESLLPVHKAQVLTYLKLSGKSLGLIINFNTALFKDGIKRIINSKNTGLLGTK